MLKMGNKSGFCACFYGVIAPDLTGVMYQLLSSSTTADNDYYQTQNS